MRACNKKPHRFSFPLFSLVFLLYCHLSNIMSSFNKLKTNMHTHAVLQHTRIPIVLIFCHLLILNFSAQCLLCTQINSRTNVTTTAMTEGKRENIGKNDTDNTVIVVVIIIESSRLMAMMIILK